MKAGIYKQTKEHKRKISEALKGKIVSMETRNKLSKKLKGYIPICAGWNKGKSMSEKSKIKLSQSLKGKNIGEKNYFYGKKFTYWKNKEFSNEHKEKLKILTKNRFKKGEIFGFRKVWKENLNFLKRENSYRWIKDRTKIKQYWTERNNPEYKQWRKNVWIRDNYKCKMNNENCSGKIIAHHILRWSLFPELRYEVNNGITLCHFHHPRKRNDEMKLSPFFQKLTTIKVN